MQTSDSTRDSIEIKLPEAGERLEAIGVMREGTAKQPENFGAIISRYQMTQNAGTVPGYFLLVCFADGSKPGGLVHPLPRSKASVAGAK